MNRGIIASLAGLVLAGATGTIILMGEEGSEMPESIVQEHQVVPRAARSPSGKFIRAVGVSSTSRDIQDTLLGRVVVGEVNKRAICNAVYESEEVDRDVFGKVKKWPVLSDGLDKTRDLIPQKIHGSKVNNKWVWWTTFKGNGCNLITEHPGYFGSTMKEFLALPATTQARFLVVDGVCEGSPCSVPVGDPRAVPGGTVSFPHSLAGRPDIDFIDQVGGVLKERYDVPDGGFDTAEIE